MSEITLRTVATARWLNANDDTTYAYQDCPPLDADALFGMPELHRCRNAEERVSLGQTMDPMAPRGRLPIAEAARDSLELYRTIRTLQRGARDSFELYRTNPTLQVVARRSPPRRLSEWLAELSRKARDSLASLMGRLGPGPRREPTSNTQSPLLDGPNDTTGAPAEDGITVDPSGDELPPNQTVDAVRDSQSQALADATTEQEQWDASYDFAARVAERRRMMDYCWSHGIPYPESDDDDEVDQALLPLSENVLY